MSKRKPCGLDYCPQEEIIGAYASCTACAWDNNTSDAKFEDVYGFRDYDIEDEFICKEPYKDCRDCPAWFMCEWAL